MEITLIESADGVWYAPDVGNNRELPESKQARALIVPMTGREMQRLEEQGFKMSRGAKLNIGHNLNKTREAIIARCVREIVNLTVRRKGQEPVAVTDGVALNKLAGMGMADLIAADILEAIKDHSLLEEGLEKKSDSPSVS